MGVVQRVEQLIRGQERPVRIAIDAMGGDAAPHNEIVGAMQALQSLPSENVELVLVGREREIRRMLSQYEDLENRYTVVHAPDVITMSDEPANVFRTKKESSLYRALELHANGYVDGFVSVGNTGAVLSIATLMLGRIPGISRPTIGSFLPTVHNRNMLLLDVGANVEVKPKYLHDFAVMGSIYMREMLNVEYPRVGLLNIGEEATKGTEVLRAAYEMLQQNSAVNFIGNVEGRDIFLGTADVVVTDGFTGNVVLKFAESMLALLKSRFRLFASRSLFHRLMVLGIKPILKRVLRGMDYQEYGGVPLLGVNGVVIIGHGSSTPKAIERMIHVAYEMVLHQVNRRIQQAIERQQVGMQAADKED